MPPKVNFANQKAFTTLMKNLGRIILPLAFATTTIASGAFAQAPSAPRAATNGPVSAAVPAAPQARLALPVPAVSKACFQLEAKAKDLSKEPQLLCVEPVGSTGNSYTLRLSTGIPGSATEVAVFNFQLQSRARCIDCNMDVFALANPSNSVFNKLSIVFRGKRDVATGSESGTVKVGATQFYYRAVK